MLSLRKNKKYFLVFITLALIVWACRKDDGVKEYQSPIEDVSWLDPIDHPAENQPNAIRFALGKKLFYDKDLSIDRSISCSSCHKPERAFADDKAISLGVDNRKGFRNTPTLTNVAFQEDFFADGGVPDLEQQAIAPIEEHDEMSFNIVEASERLKENQQYVHLSQKAYGRSPDPFVIVRALAVFERRIISTQTPWEQTVYNGKSQMTKQQQKGWEVFKISGCRKCHSGPNLTDQKYHNIGLYNNYEDNGRERITLDSLDRGKFKTPTLRNIMLTAPYMHDGSLGTITDVLNHFDKGGFAHPNKSPDIKTIQWTQEERTQLKAFFHSLTDTSFIHEYNLRKN